MQFIISWFIKKISFSALYAIVYYVLLAIVVAVILAMWAGFFAGIFYFYDLIQSFLNLITGSGISGSDLLSKFYSLLGHIGFTSAFNDTKTIFISAISFLLGRILFTVTINTYMLFMRLISPLLSN